jgi:phosphoribosylformylglycinamidine synthase
MWQFARAVEGISAACLALDIPITGGNVSLYNETDGRAIYPTPVLGVVGLIEDAGKVLGRAFRAAGEAIVLLGETSNELGASEYLKVAEGIERGVPPQLVLKAERALQQLLVGAARDGVIHSAHDCAEGGLAITLAECAFGTGGIGFDVDVAPVTGALEGWSMAAALYSESASRVVVTVPRHDLPALLARAREAGVPAREVGTTGGGRLRMSVGGRPVIDVAVHEAETIWDTALDKYFTRRAA